MTEPWDHSSDDQEELHSKDQPESWQTPITNHFDSVLECLDFLQTVEADAGSDKQEVIEGMRSRLNNMVSKILMNNTATSMSMRGWKMG